MYLMKRRHWLWFFLAILFGSCLNKKINSFDRKGERHGVWKTYFDTENQLLWTKTKFRHGKPVGHHYYYFAQTGLVERHEKYVRANKLKIWLNYPSGQLHMIGLARQEEDEKQIHFFFEGPWKVFNEKRQLIRIQHYKSGKIERVERKIYQKEDSLKVYLEVLEERFKKANANLTDSINISQNAEKKDYFKKLRSQVDSLLFTETLNFIIYSGYPSAKEVGDASAIPFYILSFAPLPFKDAALPFFEQAVDAGDISSKSFAFFVDKLRIAKNQKQVYGTQYYMKDNQQFFYPTEDTENLSERRKKVGLE
jgi:hypothetical protein